MSRRAWVVLGAVLVLCLAGGTFAVVAVTRGKPTAEPGVQTWLCRFTDGQVLLQWPSRGSAIQGTYQQATLTGQPPELTTTNASGVLSGEISGNSITADLGNGDWYGSLSHGQLTLNIPGKDGVIRPETCARSSVDAWNQSVIALSAQASSANDEANSAIAQQQAAAHLAQAEQSLTTDVAQLASDAKSLDTDKSLGADVTAGQHDLAVEQNDWSSERADQCSNLGSDAGTVGSDAGTVGSDVGTLNADISSVTDRLTTVQQESAAVQADLSAVQQQGGSPQTDPTAALALATKTITDTKKAIAWGNQQATNLGDASQTAANEAADYANAHGC